MIGIAFQRKREGFARLCTGGDAVAVVVAVRALHKFGRIVGVNAAVYPQRALIGLGAGIQIQRLAVQLRRYGVLGPEPAVHPLAAPARFSFHGRKQFLCRDLVKRRDGFVQALVLRLTNGRKQAVVQRLGKTPEFVDGLFRAFGC